MISPPTFGLICTLDSGSTVPSEASSKGIVRIAATAVSTGTGGGTTAAFEPEPFGHPQRKKTAAMTDSERQPAHPDKETKNRQRKTFTLVLVARRAGTVNSDQGGLPESAPRAKA